MSVRVRPAVSNTSTDSICAAWPLLVTSACRPSGATATPHGPASPGPSTVIASPAGAILQPDGVTGVAAGGLSAAASEAGSSPHAAIVTTAVAIRLDTGISPTSALAGRPIIAL